MTAQRSRGVLALDASACTSCMVCVRECPSWCIELVAHKESDPDAGPRGRTRLVLDEFSVDFGVCMYCGICVDVCPFDALHWAPDYDYPALERQDLVAGKSRLAEWLPSGS